MHRCRSFLAAILGVLVPAAAALAGDVEISKISVSADGAASRVLVTGRILPPEDAVLPSDVVLRVGDLDETVAGTSFTVVKGQSTYLAPGPGIVKATLSPKSGKFAVDARGVVVTEEDGYLAFTIEIAGHGVTGRFWMTGAGARSWRKGQPVRADVAGRVLLAAAGSLGPGLAPSPAISFVADDSSDQEAVVVGGPVTTDSAGRFGAIVEVRDTAHLGSMDLAGVLGSGRLVSSDDALTDTGKVRASRSGEASYEVVAVVQRRAGASGTLQPDQSLVLPASSPGGLLRVPARSSRIGATGVRFAPYEIPAALPGVLPPGYIPLAGAEIGADTPVKFGKKAKVELELEAPAWAGEEELAGASIRLLQYSGRAWREQPGEGRYDTVTGRITPSFSRPAYLRELAPAVYAILINTGRESRVRGKVVDGTGASVARATVLTRGGTVASASGGEFEVQRSAVRPQALEILQVVGEATSTARVVAGSEAAGSEIVLEVAEEAPLEFDQGKVSGTVFHPDGTTPAASASVRFGLTSATVRLTHEDVGSDGDFDNDVFTLPDLSALGVASHEWSILIPGEEEPFVSLAATGRSASPLDLMIEADGAEHELESGVYTLRVRFGSASLGTIDRYAGFRATVPQQGAIVVEDIELPTDFALPDLNSETTLVDGSYVSYFSGPLGVPITASAESSDGTEEAQVHFLFSNDVDLDITLEDQSEPPPPTEWIQKSPMPQAMAGHGAATVGNYIYILGSDEADTWRYSPATDSWTKRAKMPTARSLFGTAVVGTKIYCFGGQSFADGQALSTVEVYDTVADAWTSTTSLPFARSGCAAVTVGTKVLILGGHDGDVYFDSNDEFAPGSGTYTSRMPMLMALSEVVALEMGGLVYVATGQRSDGQGSGQTMGYNPATNAWSQGGGFRADAYGVTGARVTGNLYFAGGRNGFQYQSGFFRNEHGNLNNWPSVWTSGVEYQGDSLDLPQSRWRAAAASYQDRLFLFGGNYVQSPTATVLSLDPPEPP